MKSPKIVFLGTPGFAVASLESLLIKGFDVAGVVTAPDKPAGRGMNITASPVKLFAESHGLPVLQPGDLRDPAFLDRLRRSGADIFVVVGFRMLPEEVWKIPVKGTFNLHASLLPQYRGAAPINRVIMNGERVTGVTTFLIDEKIDTGNILFREEVPILPHENAGDLHDKLMKHGAGLVIKTVEAIAANRAQPQPQSNFMVPGEVLKRAPKIFPDDCLINWDNSPVRIYDLIRGLAPIPGARSFFAGEGKKLLFKVFESSPETGLHEYTPGHIITDGKGYLRIACRGGFISILSLQLEGKTRMTTGEFLRGFRTDEYLSAVS